MTKDIDTLIAEQNNKIAEIASLAIQNIPIDTEDILFWADVTRTSSELGVLLQVDPDDFDSNAKLYKASNGKYYITDMGLFQHKFSREYYNNVIYPVELEIDNKIRDLREFMVENLGENNNFSWITLRMDKDTLYEYKFEYEPFHNVEFLEKHHLLGECAAKYYIPYEELGIYLNGEGLAKDFIKGSIKAKELWNKEHGID